MLNRNSLYHYTYIAAICLINLIRMIKLIHLSQLTNYKFLYCLHLYTQVLLNLTLEYLKPNNNPSAK
jgi:hypothetical protein